MDAREAAYRLLSFALQTRLLCDTPLRRCSALQPLHVSVSFTSCAVCISSCTFSKLCIFACALCVPVCSSHCMSVGASARSFLASSARHSPSLVPRTSAAAVNTKQASLKHTIADPLPDPPRTHTSLLPFPPYLGSAALQRILCACVSLARCASAVALHPRRRSSSPSSLLVSTAAGVCARCLCVHHERLLPHVSSHHSSAAAFPFLFPLSSERFGRR